MVTAEQLRTLRLKWTADSDGFRAEARRLEHSDLSRHAFSIAMLEARAQAIDLWILQLASLDKRSMASS